MRVCVFKPRTALFAVSRFSQVSELCTLWGLAIAANHQYLPVAERFRTEPARLASLRWLTRSQRLRLASRPPSLRPGLQTSEPIGPEGKSSGSLAAKARVTRFSEAQAWLALVPLQLEIGHAEVC